MTDRVADDSRSTQGMCEVELRDGEHVEGPAVVASPECRGGWPGADRELQPCAGLGGAEREAFRRFVGCSPRRPRAVVR